MGLNAESVDLLSNDLIRFKSLSRRAMHYRSSYSRVYTCIYIYTRAFCVENGVCGELMTGIEAATFFWSSVR